MPGEPTESGQEPQEGQEQPAPEVPSVASADEQTSTGKGQGEDALGRVMNRLDEIESRFENLPDLVERNVQSTKDRRFQVLEEIDPDLLKRFKNYLDRFDGNEDQAIREMQIDSMLAKESQPDDRGGSQVEVRERMQEFARRVLSGAGVAFDDPDYLELVNRGYGSESEFYDALNGLVDRREAKTTKQQAAVTEATAANEGGSAPAVTDDIESVTSELQAYQSGERGRLSDPQVQTKMKELSEKHKELLKQNDRTG